MRVYAYSGAGATYSSGSFHEETSSASAEAQMYLLASASDYWAFSVRGFWGSNSQTGNTGIDNVAHSSSSLTLYWYDDDGYLLDSYSLSGSNNLLKNGRWELIRQSDSLYLRVNQTNVGIIGSCTNDIAILRWRAASSSDGGYEQYSYEDPEYSYVNIYIDDITSDSGSVAFCVDHTNDPQNEGTHTWTDSELYTHDDNITVSWGAKTTPTATYDANILKIGIKELTTGDILVEETIKPASQDANSSTEYVMGFKDYSLSGLFGENYSLYQVYLTLGGTTSDTDYIIWTYDGLSVATVILDDTQYVYGQTVTATYNITDFDTGSYNYYIKTISVYGDELDSQSITSANSTYTVVPDSDTWDTGFYYVVVQSEDQTTGAVSEIGYDGFSLSDSVLLTGTVYDAETGLALANGTVSTYQNLIWNNATFGANGTYEITDLSVSQAITYYGNRTGYSLAPWSFTPLESGQYDIDLYMFSDSISFLGSNALYGIVVSDSYHQAVENATVYATLNGTTLTTTTTDTGYYYFENISAGNYSVNASATGYVLLGGDVAVNVSGDTRYDIELSERYPDLEYGQYTLTALASGYYGSSRDYLIDEDKTITFSLTEAPSEYYEPHTVELIYMSYFSTRYEGVNVSVYSGHKDDVIVGGVPSEAATLLFSQKTGDTGGVTFELDESTTYTYYAESTDPAFTKISCFAPQDDRYYIFVYNSPFEDVDTPLDQLYYGATGYKENMTTAIIKGAFEDISNSTTLAEWWVNDSNDNQLYYTSTTANNGSFSTYVNVSNNISYTAFFRIDTGALEDTQTIKRTFNFRESVHTAFDLGFTEQWQYHVVSAFIIMLVAGLFSVRDAHMGGIIVVILGWLCIYIGYIEPTITSSLSMSFATLIAGMMYIRRQEM